MLAWIPFVDLSLGFATPLGGELLPLSRDRTASGDSCLCLWADFVGPMAQIAAPPPISHFDSTMAGRERENRPYLISIQLYLNSEEIRKSVKFEKHPALDKSGEPPPQKKVENPM